MAAPASDAPLRSDSGSAGGGKMGGTLWPLDDTLRFVSLLQAGSIPPLLTVCRATARQFRVAISATRRAEGEPAGGRHLLEAQQALADLEHVLAEVEVSHGGAKQPDWQSAWENLESLEETLHTETRYVYGPDWEMKPGTLVSKKGTWLKPDTRFSWELGANQKLYLPQGVIMPVLQIGKVTDRRELKRHEWSGQHLRVWMKPPIIRTLETRCNVWYVYWPHFQDKGTIIVPALDTWLKRSTQMSGDLQPFELIYLPKGLAVRLACAPAIVEEEWERHRHQNVHLHRKVTLAVPPLTMKQDQYDIFVGQGDDVRRDLPALR